MNERGVLRRRLAEADATIVALVSGQVDAVFDPRSRTPVLLARAQQALRESEARYRRIVETSNEGIWTLTLDAVITFANRRIADMLGYTPDEMVGRSLLDFLPAPAHERAMRRVQSAEHAIDESSDVTILKTDGTALHVELKSTAVFDADGAHVGMLALITDRTMRRKVEAALRSSEEQYRQIVEATTDGIIKVDRDASISFVNERFAHMLGYIARDLHGTSLYTLLGAAERRVVAESLRARPPGSTDAFDTVYRHRDGSDVAVNIAGSSLHDSEGRFIGSLAVVRDMTERKKLQAQLNVSDRMASVGTLAAGVAHEINNPLSAVMANLDFIAESLERHTFAETEQRPGREDWTVGIVGPLEDAREAAHRVRVIVRDLMMFSRAGPSDLNEAVDVKKVLESTVRMAWNEIKHRARLVCNYGEVPLVGASEARLGQVLLNLVVNAAQSLPEGRAEQNAISLLTWFDRNRQRVIVEVSDTGCGISPEHINRIFDPFFTTKDVGVGTGLGLAICERIVTDLGGELTVRSELGKGTTFSVALLVATAQSIAHLPAERPKETSQRGRVLIVDDEDLIVRSLMRTLGREHDVIAVTAAGEALALIAAGETYDVILCDLMMPEMTGMDLHGALTTVAPRQADRMVFLTGGAFTANARVFLAESRNLVLEKPFSPAYLREEVQRFLRHGPPIGGLA